MKNQKITEAKNQPDENVDCTWASLLFMVTAGCLLFPVFGTIVGVALIAMHQKSIEFLLALFSWRTYLSGFFIAGIPGFFVSGLLIWLIADTCSAPSARKTYRYGALTSSVGFGVPILCYTLLTGWIGIEWLFMLLIAGSFSGYTTGWILKTFYKKHVNSAK